MVLPPTTGLVNGGMMYKIKFYLRYNVCQMRTVTTWSALAFRDAPLLRPPKPATAQTQTLWAIGRVTIKYVDDYLHFTWDNFD